MALYNEVSHPYSIDPINRVYAEAKSESNGSYNRFTVEEKGDLVEVIQFMSGPLNDPKRIPGVANEDVLIMVLQRLRGFQETKFKCDTNQEAIEHIDQALQALYRRTRERRDRGVEGTHKQ